MTRARHITNNQQFPPTRIYSPEKMHCMHSGMEKSTFLAKVASNSEKKIKSMELGDCRVMLV